MEEKKIKVTLPLTPCYSSKYVTIEEKSVELEFSLIEGKHTITTQPIDVGILYLSQKPVLQAYISFTYEYDSSNNAITLYSNDYISLDSTCLVTLPKGSNELSKQYTFGRNPFDEYNPLWNHYTPLTIGLEIILKNTIQVANEIIFNSVKDICDVVSKYVPPPAIDDSEYENLCMLYKDDVFVGFIDSTKEYDDTYSLKHFGSQFDKKGTIKQGKEFANVDGSAGDPKINNQSWIKVWEAYFGNTNTCASYGSYGPGYTCGGVYGALGGHCLNGNSVKSPAYGSNNIVFIIPICSNHNNHEKTAGNTSYMKTCTDYDIVWLKNYHK